MKIIEKYIFTNLAKNFALTTFLFLFLGLLTRVFHYSSIITEQSGSIVDFVMILTLIQPKIIVILTPFTLLIATFLTYNNLIHSNEHFAIYNVGIGKFGILKPFFWVCFILFVVVIIFSAIVVPASYRKMSEIREEIATKLSSSFIKPKQFINQKGVTVFINESKEGKMAEGIVIIDERDGAKKTIVASDSGKITFDGARIMFDSGKTYVARSTDFSPHPLISNFLQYKISIFIKNFFQSTGEESVLSTKQILQKIFVEKNFGLLYEFKVRFGWAFFTILLPFGMAFCLINYFNFIRNRVNLSHIALSGGIIAYIILSAFMGQSYFNSSVALLFFYYVNIFLIFSFLLFNVYNK